MAVIENAIASSSSLVGGWLGPTVIAVVIVLAIITALAVFRERHHRRRRDALLARLAGLEEILISVSMANTDDPSVISAVRSGEHPSVTSADFTPRGALSTAISTLRQSFGPELPGPDRVDLRATCFIYDHLDEPVTPAELADGLNLSLRSLQRGLSGSLDCTPRELILGVKMREAKRCLLEEDFRVQEAARAVGFDDPFHFSRRFKAYYRVSPSEMQERIGRNVA